MVEFIIGVLIVCVIVAPVGTAMFYRSRRRKHAEDIKTAELEGELARLTGELAHEIRNPLSTVKVNLKLTEEALSDVASADPHKALSEQHRQKLASAMRKITIVQKETDRLEQIVDGFLRYVRQPDLQLETLNLSELVGDMIDFYSPQAHRHRLTVRQSLSSEPLMCRIDPAAVKQVLLNLFINAQQAMDDGGELMIHTYHRADRAVVQINDTGRGIAPERLPTIFQPYSSSRAGGTGLGLATARKIIEAHDGTIAVHSEPGRGTSFTIELPMIEAGLEANEKAPG